jgi:hypothetical protein
MGDRHLVLPPWSTGRVHPFRREQRFDLGFPDHGQRMCRFVVRLYRAQEGWIGARDCRNEGAGLAGRRDRFDDYSSRVWCVVKELGQVRLKLLHLDDICHDQTSVRFAGLMPSWCGGSKSTVSYSLFRAGDRDWQRRKDETSQWH